jgi:hypothetical protein
MAARYIRSSRQRGPSAGVPAGYFTTRHADTALREILDEARRGTLPAMCGVV